MAVQNVAHEKLVNEILRRYGARDEWRIWKNSTGTAFQGRRRISFGLVGSSDIIGLLRPGIFVALEVKTGKAVLSNQQRSFKKMIEEMGGIHCVIRDIEQVESIFK